MRNTTILHNIKNTSKHEYDSLTLALQAAWEQRATGYVVDPGGEVINLKNGKRPGMKKGSWVPAGKPLKE